MESELMAQPWRSRRLGLADLLDEAWGVFAGNVWEFLVLGTLPVAVHALLPLAPEHPGPGDLPRLYGQGLVVVLISLWAGLATIDVAGKALDGARPGLVRPLLAGLRSLVPALLTMALLLVLSVVPILVLILPVAVLAALAGADGAAAGTAIGGASLAIVAVAVVPLLVALTYLYFILQIVQLRRHWGWGALAGSARLVRGRFWRVLGMLLVLHVPVGLLALLDSLVPHTHLARTLALLPTIAVTPFVAVCATLLFLNLEAVRRAPASPGAAPAPVSVLPSAHGGAMKILVLGGGAQGRVIASDIAVRLPQASVTVADIRDPGLPARPNLAWREADCSAFDTVVGLMGEHDLAVGALPSRYGFAAMKAAIAARRNLVDVSFCAEDALLLNAAARDAGIAIVPDAGLAPGISNLLAGEAYRRRGAPLELMIMVGGVAQDASKPYGYCVTWSLDDLTEEYVRPARIVRGGEKVVVPVFSGLELVEVEGVGTMEAFYSDGLRSLMDTLPGVPEMGEKTLRWPGHVAEVGPLVSQGRLAEELRARCTLAPPEDLVALVVRLRWADGEELTTLVDRYDPASGLTAMARTTAFTTAVTAQMLAGGLVPPPGVQPLERVAADPRAYRAMVDGLAAHGVRLGRGGAA